MGTPRHHRPNRPRRQSRSKAKVPQVQLSPRTLQTDPGRTRGRRRGQGEGAVSLVQMRDEGPHVQDTAHRASQPSVTAHRATAGLGPLRPARSPTPDQTAWPTPEGPVGWVGSSTGFRGQVVAVTDRGPHVSPCSPHISGRPLPPRPTDPLPSRLPRETPQVPRPWAHSHGFSD